MADLAFPPSSGLALPEKMEESLDGRVLAADQSEEREK
jgi:hypothetical protein